MTVYKVSADRSFDFRTTLTLNDNIDRVKLRMTFNAKDDNEDGMRAEDVGYGVYTLSVVCFDTEHPCDNSTCQAVKLIL